MRSKKINYKNGASGFIASKTQFEPMKTPVSLLQNKSTFGTSSEKASITDKVKAIAKQARTIPTEVTTPATLQVEAVPAETDTLTKEAVQARGTDAPMAVSTGIGTGTAKQAQPEANKAKYRTWIIIGIILLIALYLYRKK